MAPTPLALELADPVRAVLEGVETLFTESDGFQPDQSDRVFTIGLSDYAAFVFLPGLAARIERAAPNVQLVVRNTSHVLGLPMIEADEVELIVGNFPDPPGHMSTELLFHEDFVCAMRQGHPAAHTGLTAETYFELRHLNVSLHGEPHGYLGHLVPPRGPHRHVSVTAGHFLMAPFVLQTTDTIATEPRRIMEPLAEMMDLRLMPPPVEIPPFAVTQIWHRRYNADPGHQWLRAILHALARSET